MLRQSIAGPLGRLCGLGLAAIMLSGCAFLSGGTPATTYDLTSPGPAATLQQASVSPATAILVIPEPTALAAVDSERVLVKPMRSVINYYPNSRWSDRLPRLVQARMVQAFENANRLRSVGRPGDGLDADFQLVTDLRSFEVLVEPGPSAVVEISAKIVSVSTGRIGPARLFSARVPLADDGIGSGIAGLDAALNQVLAEIVPWATGRL